MIVDLQNERDVYKEVNRILLRENLDLRDVLEDNNLLDVESLNNLKDLFSPFGDTIVVDEEEDDNE